MFDVIFEAPVSWKTIQKAFLSKYGEEGLNNIAKSIDFNNFQDFYQDVYKTLYKDQGGRKYEPSFMELIKIFKFLLDEPENYKQQKQAINKYGYLRYLGNEEVVQALIKIKTKEEFNQFLENVLTYEAGDVFFNYEERLKKVYSDSNIDIFHVPRYTSCPEIFNGTTWCIKEKEWFSNYSIDQNSLFYIIVSKKEWYEQNKGIRKKYALRINRDILDPKIDEFVDKFKTIEDFYKAINFNVKAALFDKFLENLKTINYRKFYDVLKDELTPEEKSIHKNLEYSFIHGLDIILLQNNLLHIGKNVFDETDATYDLNDYSKKTQKALKKVLEYLDSGSILLDKIKEKIEDDQMIKQFLLLPNLSNYYYIHSIYQDIISSKFDILRSSTETEFTNNNQNVRFVNFFQLPEPYHTMLKNFDIYRKINRAKIIGEVNHLEREQHVKMFSEMIESYFDVMKEDVKNQIKAEFNLMIDQLQGIIKRLKKYFNKEQEQNDLTLTINDLNITRINDKTEYYSILGNDHANREFANNFKDYEYYYITDSDKNIYFVKVLNEEIYSNLRQKIEEVKEEILQNDLIKLVTNFKENNISGSEAKRIIKNFAAKNLNNVTLNSQAIQFKVDFLLFYDDIISLVASHQDFFGSLSPDEKDLYEKIMENQDTVEITEENKNSIIKITKFLKNIRYELNDFKFNVIAGIDLKYIDLQTLIYTYILNAYKYENISKIFDLKSSEFIDKMISFVSKTHYSNDLYFDFLDYSSIGIRSFTSTWEKTTSVWNKLSDLNLKFVKQIKELREYIKFFDEIYYTLLRELVFIVTFDDVNNINILDENGKQNYKGSKIEHIIKNITLTYGFLERIIISFGINDIKFNIDNIEDVIWALYIYYNKNLDVFNLIHVLEDKVKIFVGGEEEEGEE